MRGKQASKKTNSRVTTETHAKSTRKKPLTAKTLGISARIVALEQQMEELKGRIRLLELELVIGPKFEREPEETEDRKRTGPKEKIDDFDLFYRRDLLISWLESIWPAIVDQLEKTSHPPHVRALFEEYAVQRDSRPAWQTRFLEEPGVLVEFLLSDRYGKTLPHATVVNALTLPFDDKRRARAANRLPTRRIANAMAGVPDLKWRTSFDKCSERPSQARVGPYTEFYYRRQRGLPAAILLPPSNVQA